CLRHLQARQHFFLKRLPLIELGLDDASEDGTMVLKKGWNIHRILFSCYQHLRAGLFGTPQEPRHVSFAINVVVAKRVLGDERKPPALEIRKERFGISNAAEGVGALAFESPGRIDPAALRVNQTAEFRAAVKDPGLRIDLAYTLLEQRRVTELDAR